MAPIGAARQEDNEAVAQVAHAADVDVAHRRVVGAREDGEEVEVLRGSLHGVVRVLQAAQLHLAGFPTERVPKMPLSGVSARSGDLARFTFKGLDGTMTDLFIHLVAYQLVTLSGTGVSVLD